MVDALEQERGISRKAEKEDMSGEPSDAFPSLPGSDPRTYYASVVHSDQQQDIHQCPSSRI